MNNRSLAIATLSACTLLSPLAAADESLWVYAKGTDTLPEGKYEIKLNTIFREGKDSGDYTFNDIRPEFEYGLTDRLTLSAELMFFDHNYSVVDCIGPVFETQGNSEEECNEEGVLTVEPGRFNDTQFAGYEIGAKYNILSPYADPIGLTVGLAFERRDVYRLDGADINQNSYVGNILLQKNFLDDTLAVVLNTKLEFERRKNPGYVAGAEGSVLEEEFAYDLSVGISYRVAPKWYVGLEWRQQSDFLNPLVDGEFDPDLERTNFDIGDFRIGSRHQYGSYIGPSVHYGTQNWWATLGALWQFKGGGSFASFNRGGRNLDEHEKVHVGLTLARQF
ncbi:outer membrane beta-barrel protein [bacterium SCSIO 12696]|nr:outer membrane beta-barrel protein [bacterium SCSIO 12696]